MRVAVLGAGSWGTALGRLLALKGHDVLLWARRKDLAEELRGTRENRLYLPDHPFPAGLDVTATLAEALEGADMVFVAVPLQHVRASLADARPWLSPGALWVGAAKGLERETLFRLSEVLRDVWGPGRYAVISGPSFALEVARGEPTAVTVAADDGEVARRVQREIAGESFRVYSSDDVIGVELAGALKNVIAIAAGMMRGLGLGSNSLAALLTRGLVEVRRLGVTLGGRPETFLGLSGMGDLILTGTGSLSRNARLGEAVGRGRKLAEVVGETNMIAEGVDTALSAYELSRRHRVEMPITSEVVQVLFHGRDPRVAARNLMARDLKAEEQV